MRGRILFAVDLGFFSNEKVKNKCAETALFRLG
jgi:hypothetical protein